MRQRVAHIHFGPSKLALGLILPIANEVGLSTHLIGRPGVSARPAFGVSLVPRRPVSFFPLASFTGPRTLNEFEPRIKGALQAGSPMLITTTLREGIVDRYEVIRELLRARGPKDETVFIACENSPDRLYEKLREEFEPAGVQFLDTVVNRICPRYLPPSRGRRVVLAHELGEWLIKTPDREGAIAPLLACSKLVTFHDDLVPFEERKRWLVNGGQLYLALLAHGVGEKSLVKAANSELRDPMTHFHSEVNRVLRANHPALTDNLEYALKYGKAFCEITDDVPRMVALHRANLSPFFRAFRRRIGEPAGLAAGLEGGRTPEVFTRALGALDTVLEKPNAYAEWDPDDLSWKADLDPGRDALAVEEYGAALKGWVESEAIVAAERRLAIILRSHRNQPEPPTRWIKPA